MLTKYKNKINRTVYLSVAILLGIAAFATFQIQRSQAQSAGEVVNIATTAPAFIDAGFNPVIGGANGQIVDSFVQADGKILIGGEFRTMNGVNRNSLARFNADGSLDTTFNTGSGASEAIYSIAQQSTGKIIITGAFTSFNGVPASRIARLNLDGSVDQSFNAVGVGVNSGTGGNDVIQEVKVLSDDRIMIGGLFTTYNGTAAPRLARLNADGGLDTSFTVGTGPNQAVNVITVQPDGKVLIGGRFLNYAGNSSIRVARVNTDGTFDSSFVVASGAEQEVMSLTVQPDGKVIVSGFMTTFGGFPANGVIRLLPTGAVDSTFNVAGLDAVVIAVALQPDGKVILGGSFTQIANATRQCLVRVNADGTNDATFDPLTSVGPQIINKLTLQSDGKVIANGTFTTYQGTPNGGAVRINPNGTIDTPLGTKSSVVGNIQALAVQADNKVIVGGSFTIVGSTPRLNIARVNADGTNDASFDPGTGANQIVQAILVQPDGKIILGGSFTTYNGVTVNRIVRVNPDGTIDSSFVTGTGLNSNIETMVLLPDGKILVGGAFTTYNTVTVNRLMRLNTDGTLDTTFTTGTAMNGTVRHIAVQPDGKLMVGGGFTSYNTVTRNRVARINADGTLDTTFDPLAGPNNNVNSLAVNPDGKVVIGGSFTAVAGTARLKVARLNVNGTLDTTFDHGGSGLGPGTAPEITKVLSVENGKTIVSGSFLTFNGVVKNRLARLNTNGKVDTTFLSGLGAQAPTGLTVRALIHHPDGSILMGGQFSIFNVSPRTGLAKFRNATDTYADFDGDGKTDFAVGRRPASFGPWTWWIVNSSNDAMSVVDWGSSPSDEFQPGDFDGDGKDDIAVYRKLPAGGSPAYYIINSATNTVRIIPFGQSGDVPLTEDYDGDGKDDLSVWRAPAVGSTGQATWFYLGSLNNPNNNVTFVPWGMRYGATQSDQVDEPYPGDFDGDGKADFRVQRRADTSVTSSSTPAVFYTLLATGQTSYDYWGWAGDRIVPGDYDGDGKTDLAVSRGFNSTPSTTTWYIRYTDGRPDEAIAWGAGSLDLFAQGDYDGDGITDLAVYRRAGEYNFYVRRSSDGMMQVYHLGDSNNSIPVTNYNNR